jgi:hypothetical protein
MKRTAATAMTAASEAALTSVIAYVVAMALPRADSNGEKPTLGPARRSWCTLLRRGKPAAHSGSPSRSQGGS